MVLYIQLKKEITRSRKVYVKISLSLFRCINLCSTIKQPPKGIFLECSDCYAIAFRCIHKYNFHILLLYLILEVYPFIIFGPLYFDSLNTEAFYCAENYRMFCSIN